MNNSYVPIAVAILLLTLSPFSQAQNFTEIAASVGLNHGSAKDGGVAWADLNNDGCLDMIFNTNQNNQNNRSRILFSDCNLPNPRFSDVTASHADGMRQNKCERSISVGDYNNDGFIDFCRNSNNRIEVYINKGPSATPAYSFGDAGQNPNFVLTNVPGGLNSEGFGWMDYDNDGWLDLVIENHNFGIDLYRNPADGTANFVHTTPNGSTLGLPSGGTSGDFMTLTDYNDDGFVDILARKEDDLDIWTNTGAGTFNSNPSFNQDANNSNKGGVLFCDFDNDGDFDLFWSDQGVNQIYEQVGFNSGNFAPTNEPATSSGITINNSIDGCSCGDVDNDGDMDLFIGGSGLGNSYLFLNNSPSRFTFTLNNLGLLASGDTEGNSFADYDNDGDLDLYININGNDNELWRNDLNNDNYLKVDIKRDLGLGVFRDDLGANVILKDCNGDILGGIRQVSSVKGHGSNDPSVIHFGLPNGNTALYVIEVHFTSINGVRSVLDTAIVPSSLNNQRISLASSSATAVLDQCDIFLPIELLSFDVVAMNENKVRLDWKTVKEIDNAFFTVERSSNSQDWENIEEVLGAGNSNVMNYYNTYDNNPLSGTSYYRLKQTDFDGQSTYSDIKAVTLEGNALPFVRLYPNPAGSQVTVEGSEEELSKIEIYNAAGQRVTHLTRFSAQHQEAMQIDISNLSTGIYTLKTKTIARKLHKL